MSDAQKTALLLCALGLRVPVFILSRTHSTRPDYLVWSGYFNGHPWHQAVTIEIDGDPLVAFLGIRCKSVEIYQISDFDYRGSHVPPPRPELGGP
jgi:hypothetical protein